MANFGILKQHFRQGFFGINGTTKVFRVPRVFSALKKRDKISSDSHNTFYLCKHGTNCIDSIISNMKRIANIKTNLNIGNVQGPYCTTFRWSYDIVRAICFKEVTTSLFLRCAG